MVKDIIHHSHQSVILSRTILAFQCAITNYAALYATCEKFPDSAKK